MIYVLFNKGVPVHVADKNPCKYTHEGMVMMPVPGVEYDVVKDSRDFTSLEEVNDVAQQLTEKMGKTFLGYDEGDHCYPRFGIFGAPSVGDEVSYAFNGDYYPCGTITKITKGWRITTSTGAVFNRKKNKPGWLMVGGTWRLVAGHHDERNPSF